MPGFYGRSKPVEVSEWPRKPSVTEPNQYSGRLESRLENKVTLKFQNLVLRCNFPQFRRALVTDHATS